MTSKTNHSLELLYYHPTESQQRKRKLLNLPEQTVYSESARFTQTFGDLSKRSNSFLNARYNLSGTNITNQSRKWFEDIKSKQQLKGYINAPLISVGQLVSIPSSIGSNQFAGSAGTVRNIISNAGPILAFPKVNNEMGKYGDANIGLYPFNLTLDPNDPLSVNFARQLFDPAESTLANQSKLDAQSDALVDKFFKRHDQRTAEQTETAKVQAELRAKQDAMLEKNLTGTIAVPKPGPRDPRSSAPRDPLPFYPYKDGSSGDDDDDDNNDNHGGVTDTATDSEEERVEENAPGGLHDDGSANTNTTNVSNQSLSNNNNLATFNASKDHHDNIMQYHLDTRYISRMNTPISTPTKGGTLANDSRNVLFGKNGTPQNVAAIKNSLAAISPALIRSTISSRTWGPVSNTSTPSGNEVRVQAIHQGSDTRNHMLMNVSSQSSIGTPIVNNHVYFAETPGKLVSPTKSPENVVVQSKYPAMKRTPAAKGPHLRVDPDPSAYERTRSSKLRVGKKVIL